jgi:hypothetical protein
VAIEAKERNPIRRALNFLAKMGLTVRDDPPRVIDAASRTWGDPADGFALSIEPLPQEEQGAPPGLSVVLRNTGSMPQTISAPGWLAFFSVEIPAEPSPFGLELMKPERQTMRVTATLAPGELFETQIPVGSLFDLRTKGEYRTQVSCMLPDGATLVSNPVILLV